MTIKKKIFEGMPDRKKIVKFIISNNRGISAVIMNYGAALVSLKFPDKNGKPEEVTLGFEHFKQYLEDEEYRFGSTIGRFANRIAKAKFSINNRVYTLSVNDTPNHIHGGFKGFDKVLWEADDFNNNNSAGVILKYNSIDGEEGYPGNLNVKVVYSLNNKNVLEINYEAETDKPTPVNLSNHIYWNLSGAGSKTIKNHLLTLNCDKYLIVNDSLVPTGKIRDVTGTPMDFRVPKLVGKDMDNVPGGYDNCFIINRKSDSGLCFAAKLHEPESGRTLEILTTKPGVQFYSGNHLDNVSGRKNKVYPAHSGLCLETQYYPDSVNKPNFPSVILNPGEVYKHTTVFKFSI